MAPLPFDLSLLQYLAEHRTTALTAFFRCASFVGEVEGYLLVVLFVYVAIDKTLAVRLSVVVLLAMSLNHLLKIAIGNPRPFIADGSYTTRWAVPAENARELATEYSTPSGHAMAAAAFYSYLYAVVRHPVVRAVALLAILLTGLSRPYLGVHYAEDILLGWPLGLAVALASLAYGERLARRWRTLSHARQVQLVVAASLGLWLITVAVNGWRVDGQPRAFLGYAGFLTGIVVARPLEVSRVGFDATSSSRGRKGARYLLTVGLVMLVLVSLGELFDALADRFSLLGYALQYVRYTLVGVTSLFLAPLAFTSLGLAEATAGQATQLSARARETRR